MKLDYILQYMRKVFYPMYSRIDMQVFDAECHLMRGPDDPIIRFRGGALGKYYHMMLLMNTILDKTYVDHQ